MSASFKKKKKKISILFCTLYKIFSLNMFSFDHFLWAWFMWFAQQFAFLPLLSKFYLQGTIKENLKKEKKIRGKLYSRLITSTVFSSKSEVQPWFWYKKARSIPIWLPRPPVNNRIISRSPTIWHRKLWTFFSLFFLSSSFFSLSLNLSVSRSRRSCFVSVWGKCVSQWYL